MHVVPPSGQDRDAERDLVGELARAVVRRVAPEELGLFEETQADFFRDPGLMRRTGRRDKAVGFGLDVALLTPYVLMAGTAVVHFLATVVSDAVRDEVGDELKPVIGGRIRWLLRREGTPTPDGQEQAQQGPAPARGVTADQARAVHRVALQQAKQSGLDDERASLLADAFVGALVVNG